MKKSLLIGLALLLAGTGVARPIVVKTGIEVLKAQRFELLEGKRVDGRQMDEIRPLDAEGKRVGLITNPTGVDDGLRSTVDILNEAPNVELVALFGPEHGVRGDAHAGDHVGNQTDPVTGLPVYSLYGKTRKPTSEMLRGIDVLVYDIQDIGCRSFTYISTMGEAMAAAAENGIEFVVLDRPNPLGGRKVEGPLVQDGFFSFVSQYRIPYVYGLTCGELAMLLNGEGMIGKPCNLHVVAMEGWKRDMVYEDTGLQWIPSSPHIPQAETAFFYPASGIVGDFGYLSIGVGYTIPFQMFAAEWIDAEQFADSLNALKLPGVIFRPIHVKPFYSVGQGKQLHGVQVHLTKYPDAPLTDIQFYVMQEIARLYPDRAVLANADTARFRMMDQVTGSDYVRKTFAARNRFEDIRAYWYKDVAPFRTLSRKYYLYGE